MAGVAMSALPGSGGELQSNYARRDPAPRPSPRAGDILIPAIRSKTIPYNIISLRSFVPSMLQQQSRQGKYTLAGTGRVWLTAAAHGLTLAGAGRPKRSRGWRNPRGNPPGRTD